MITALAMPPRRSLRTVDRGRAMAWIQDGQSVRHVARRLAVSHSTIQRIFERFQDTVPSPRSTVLRLLLGGMANAVIISTTCHTDLLHTNGEHSLPMIIFHVHSKFNSLFHLLN